MPVGGGATVEIELKYRVEGTCEQLEQLWQHLQGGSSLEAFPCGTPSELCIRDLYYDTPDRRLKAAGYTLRLRLENDACLTTLKYKVRKQGARKEREEWEEPVSRETLARFALILRRSGLPVCEVTEQDAQRFAAGEPAMGLVPLLCINTERVQRPVRTDTGVTIALLNLDRVSYPGLTDERFHDIELEQAAEGEGWLERVGRALEEALGPLGRPSSHSKVNRGFELIRNSEIHSPKEGTHGNDYRQ